MTSQNTTSVSSTAPAVTCLHGIKRLYSQTYSKNCFLFNEIIKLHTNIYNSRPVIVFGWVEESSHKFKFPISLQYDHEWVNKPLRSLNNAILTFFYSLLSSSLPSILPVLSLVHLLRNKIQKNEA